MLPIPPGQWPKDPRCSCIFLTPMPAAGQWPMQEQLPSTTQPCHLHALGPPCSPTPPCAYKRHLCPPELLTLPASLHSPLLCSTLATHVATHLAVETLLPRCPTAPRQFPIAPRSSPSRWSPAGGLTTTGTREFSPPLPAILPQRHSPSLSHSYHTALHDTCAR